jgi:hypothetical protein
MTAVQYEMRVDGQVPDGVLDQVEGLRRVTVPVGSTLRVTARDQAALQGVIGRLLVAGLVLVEIRCVEREFGNHPGRWQGGIPAV